MTKEEAKEILSKKVKPCVLGEWGEAIDMAIESLSNYTTKKPNDIVEQKNDVVAEPTDLISRADAIKAVRYLIYDRQEKGAKPFKWWFIKQRLNAIPSADRPRGEWIIDEDADSFYCSNCKGHALCENVIGTDWVLQSLSDFCPNCGAKMGSDTR